MPHHGYTKRHVVVIIAFALIALPVRASVGQTTEHPCGAHGGGSGGMEFDGYDLVYSVSTDPAGFTVNSVVLVRGPIQFLRSAVAPVRPRSWTVNGVPRGLAGGTAGKLSIGHERRTNTTWIDSAQVPMGENNVLLVSLDSGGVPHVAGRARIEPQILESQAACDASTMVERQRWMSGVLQARLHATQAVRDFLDELHAGGH